MAERPHNFLREGIITGFIGATAIAVWFLIVDTIAGHPFYTPIFLGKGVVSILAADKLMGEALREGGPVSDEKDALHQVVGAERMARDAGAITLFKSLGVGLEDVAAASLVYDRAMASGRFKPL